jgi:oligosaccharide repeat unit polymerase
VIGQPTYDIFPGLQVATKDETTFWIYCLYVAIAPVIWWYTGKPKKNRQSQRFFINSNLLTPSFLQLNVNYRLGKYSKLFFTALCYLMLFLPLIIWCFSPNPSIYLNYGSVASGLLSKVEEQYFGFIYRATYISALGGSGLIILMKNKNPFSINKFYLWLIICIGLATSIWLNGKRNIIPFVFLLIIMSLVVKSFLKGRSLLILTSIFLVAFAYFSYSYQTELVRKIEAKQIYEISRLDFARDHLVKLAIYSELHPDNVKILDYRLQTIYNAYIPRSLWADKPKKIYNYNHYIAVASLKISLKDFKFGITGTWLSEALSNFGWMGMLIGLLVMSWFCRTGDATNNKFVVILTSFMATIMLLLSLGFLPIFFAVFWFPFIAYERFKKVKQ